MENDPFEEIKNALSKIDFELTEHEPVFTSEQAAQVRNESLSIGAKSLVIKSDGKYYVAVLAGDKRLDSKKIKKALNIKDFRFAKPEEVNEVVGCEIGACYPFGSLINLKTIVDEPFTTNEFMVFNPGRHDRTIKLTMKDYLEIEKPLIGDISE